MDPQQIDHERVAKERRLNNEGQQLARLLEQVTVPVQLADVSFGQAVRLGFGAGIGLALAGALFLVFDVFLGGCVSGFLLG